MKAVTYSIHQHQSLHKLATLFICIELLLATPTIDFNAYVRPRLGVEVKNYGGQYGVQWACSGPSAWNKIYVLCTVPTFVCKLHYFPLM
jgi:hypothetical protein